MIRITSILLLLSVTSIIAGAAIFSDDFESYNPGMDLDDTANWTHFDAPGSLIVVEEGANNYVSHTDITTYTFDTPGILTDSEISFDFRFTGDWSLGSAAFRLNVAENKGYIVSVCHNIPGTPGHGDYVRVGFANGTTHQWQAENIFYLDDYFDDGVWYHLDAMIYGFDPIMFKFTLDGNIDESGEVVTALPAELADGKSGLATHDFYVGDVHFDNFQVNDAPDTAIKSASLGSIKASFR